MKEISNQILKPQQTKQLRQRLKLSKLHLCLLTLLFFIFNQVRLAQAELPKKTNFKCGVVSGITGPLSVVGTAIKNGVVLGVKEHDHNQRVKLIIEDDQFLPKNTVSAVNKLINSDNVDCLIIFGSSTALSVINTTEQKKIPLIAIALAEDVSKNREYSYRMYTSIPKITEVMSAEITRRGYKSIAIISTIQDATLSTTQALKSIAKTKIVLEQEMNIGDIDFRSIALKIKALNPDAVFFSMLPPQPSNLARQLRSLNYKGEFFAGPQIANLDDIKSASTALENTWFVTLNDLGAKDFYDKYQEEFHESTPAESILGYDSGRIISEAAESGDIHKYLEDLKEMEGLGGKYILKDHSFEIPARVRLIKDGTYLNN